MTFSARMGARKFFRLVRVIALGALSFTLAIAFTSAQSSSSAVSDLAARINRERIARGMIPYALNAKLSTAAQAHANDIARTKHYSHTGSDGSNVFDRVARAGYGAYSWGRRIGENWAWYHDPATAMKMWMGSAPHRNNILHTVYREFGIGIAPAENGGNVYVVDFGAQPNVLPIFIQNGASSTISNKVIIALSNEDYATNGDGGSSIGQAKQVEISSSPNFAGAQWQPFAPRFDWTLPSGSGTKTIYVKYRDARGRTVTSSDSIASSASAQPPSPTIKPTLKPSPTSTKPKPTATKTKTPLPLPSITLTPAASTTAVATLPVLTATPEPTAATTETFEPTEILAPELTETPPSDSVAIALGETPTGMIDSQDEMPLAPVLPTVAPGFSQASMQEQVAPIALGIMGMSAMLGVLALVKWLAHRADRENSTVINTDEDSF